MIPKAKVKIVIVGAVHTGKTSISNRYINSDFTSQTISTTQPVFSQKEIQHKNLDISLEIWDTAGQERYHALSPLFYRNADAGIVVFDITDNQSFQKATKWAEDLKQERDDEVFIVFAGNKSDLHSQRAVSKSDAQALASRYHAPYFETSAKTNENIDAVFTAICDFVSEKNSAITTPPESGKSLRSSIQFKEEDGNQRKKGCC